MVLLLEGSHGLLLVLLLLRRRSVTDMQGQVKVESFVYFATRFFS